MQHRKKVGVVECPLFELSCVGVVSSFGGIVGSIVFCVVVREVVKGEGVLEIKRCVDKQRKCKKV